MNRDNVILVIQITQPDLPPDYTLLNKQKKYKEAHHTYYKICKPLIILVELRDEINSRHVMV